ncbi:hypothetical protein [Sagittula stellata]|uniref:Uncharacterized protein n=1 Tax=Sagittula stellata (strain ATCC 700073 / DSM 11524 / E-37) TaxID=388399 RepID=A3K1Z2_SAGS3|nr:hypothetical protein [Sagittula stellata]EBA08938.1 hypothetical protein SSE37_04810 [Sagittula stellata E-37]
MFAALSGFAAMMLSAYAATIFARGGLYLHASACVVAGLCTFALLKTLADIAGHLEALGRDLK